MFSSNRFNSLSRLACTALIAAAGISAACRRRRGEQRVIWPVDRLPASPTVGEQANVAHTERQHHADDPEDNIGGPHRHHRGQ